MLPVGDRPVQHREIFLTAGRSQIDEVRNICEQGDVVEAGVGHVVHTLDSAPEHEHQSWVVIDAEIL